MTEVKPGAQLTIAGQDLTAANGAYSVAITLNSVPLATVSVVVTSGVFETDVTIPSTTSPGTHQVCAFLLGENQCFNILVCTSCQPKLGFIKGTPDFAQSSVDIYKPLEVDSDIHSCRRRFRRLKADQRFPRRRSVRAKRCSWKSGAVHDATHNASVRALWDS